jgi:O-antigen/teichoic acid export membrane protein
LIFYLLTWAPQFVLASTRGPIDVAYFTVAARLAAFISLVPAIQLSYLAPAIARLYHSRKVLFLNDLCNASAWQATLAAAVPTLLLIVASQPLITLLFGGSFVSAALPLSLLALAGFSSVALGQVNQLMLLCDLEGSALLLNVAWLAAWATIGVPVSATGGVVAASAFAFFSAVLYSVLAARLLVKNRGIYSFIRLPMRLALDQI